MNVIIAACFAALLSAPPPAPVDHDDFRAASTQWLHRYGVATDVPSLLRAMSEDPRPTVRLTAADLLGRLEEKSAAAVMRAALGRDTDEKVRAHLGWDLLKIEGEQALPVVHALLLRTQDLDNRIYLAGPLAELGDFSGYADVLKGLESGAPPTRWFAADALAAFVAKCRGCGLTPPPVDEALRWAKIPAMRPSIVFPLSQRLDDPRVIAALTVMANDDKDEFVRHSARVFLRAAELQNQKAHGDHQ